MMLTLHVIGDAVAPSRCRDFRAFNVSAARPAQQRADRCGFSRNKKVWKRLILPRTMGPSPEVFRS